MFPFSLGQQRLILAADARTVSEPPTMDLVWVVHRRSTPPLAAALETNLGLQVQALAVFPLFAEARGPWLVDVGEHVHPPHVVEAFPDALTLALRPFLWLEVHWHIAVEAEGWVRGRLIARHLGAHAQTLRWGLAGWLRPLHRGTPFEVQERKDSAILVGETPWGMALVYLTGGPEGTYEPYPALVLETLLEPQQRVALSWVVAFGQDTEDTLIQARHLAAEPWEAIEARRRILDAQIPAIHTGHARADRVLEHGRRRAAHFVARTPEGGMYLLLRREPETSWANTPPRADLPTYPEIWYALTQYALPGLAPWVPGYLERLLHITNPRGEPDGWPGLDRPQGRFLAHPLLVDALGRTALTWFHPDWLARLLPRLEAYLAAWFTPTHDADQDGWPEWEHALQMGWPGPFPATAPDTDTVDLGLHVVESPSLLGFLFRAVHWLGHLARLLQRPETAAQAEVWAARLYDHWRHVWEPRAALARYRDRDTHLSHPARLLWRGRGSGTAVLERVFPRPLRPVVHVFLGRDGLPRSFTVVLQGRDAYGRAVAETFGPARFRHEGGRMVAVAEHAFAALKAVRVEGLPRRARIQVRALDLRRPDLSLFVPLWAGLADPETARRMAERHLAERSAFWAPGGWSWYPATTDKTGARPVALWWNTLLIEGLTRAGLHSLAVSRLTSLLAFLGDRYERDSATAALYHGETGQPYTPTDTLAGLPPLGLVLVLAGIWPLPNLRLALLGPSRLTFPLTLRLAHATVVRVAERTEVRYPWGTRKVFHAETGVLDLRQGDLAPLDELPQTQLWRALGFLVSP